MSQDAYNNIWLPHNNELTSLKKFRLNFEFWMDTTQVQVPYSRMSFIHFIPFRFFIPSDFRHIFAILQQ